MNLSLILIIAAAVVAFGMLVLAFAGPSVGKAKSRRLATVRDRHANSTEAVVAAQMRRTIAASGSSDSISSLIPRRDLMERRLRRTGKNWDLSKYIFVCMGLFVLVTGGLLVLRTPFPLAVMVGLLGGIWLPFAYVGRLIKKRVNAFTTRFPDAIDLLVRGLKSGLPVTETFQVVSHELPGPVGEEFRGVVERIRIGNTMEAALQESADMLGTPEFQFFCITLTIQRETGGNLAETLANLATVLRQRAQMKLKINAMSSESKASAWIIGSLPFIVFALISWINFKYMSPFFTPDPAGIFGLSLMQVIGIGGMCWMAIGAFIMAQMVNFEI